MKKIIIVLLVIGSMLLVGCGGAEIKHTITPAEFGDRPITISLSTMGRFGLKNPWHLSVNSKGQAELTIERGRAGKRAKLQFQVTDEQFANLRKVLIEEKYFDLKDTYGEHLVDCAVRTLTIAAGDLAKTVKIYSFTNLVIEDNKSKLIEGSGIIRILFLLQAWIKDERPFDLTKWDHKVLEATKIKK